MNMVKTCFLGVVWVLSCAAQPTTFVYVGNNGSLNISAYSLNQTTGALTALPSSPFPVGQNVNWLLIHPNGKFAYLSTASIHSVTAYAIDGNTGMLTPIAGSPFATGAGSFPSKMVMHPNGQFLYVMGASSVVGFIVNGTTGALTPLPGSPFSLTASGASIAVDPAGRFLYVASNSSGNISAFAIDGTTGVLTGVPGSPFPGGANLAWVSVHPSGRFVYAADFGFGSGSAFGYTVNPTTGALTHIPGSVAVGKGPHGGVIEPTGQFLYLSGQNTDGVLGYRIDPTTGALTLVAGSPFPSGYWPPSLAVDPSGRFLFAPNSFDANVSTYGIDLASGVLTEAPGSPFLAGTAPDFVAAVIGSPSAPSDTVGPITSSVNVSPNPVPVNTGSSLAATVDDSTTGGSNIASADYTISGGSPVPMTLASMTPVTQATAVLPPFLQSNVYEICLEGTDAVGNMGAPSCIPLPVYDPTGGFVTGGGRVHSPAGADLPNPTAGGSANFGFVSKYLPGANVPSGNLEFRFQAGNLNFKSTSMDWLVVTGQPRAMFRGTGTVNGSSVCKFEVDAWDASFQPGNADAFGLKIFSCASGGDRYNLAATPLTNGNIIIHK